MKRVARVMMACVWLIGVIPVWAQTKIDEDRMKRDIEVSENVLSTLIRQQYGKQIFFPMEVHGSYMAGFGVTFRLPGEFFMPQVAGVDEVMTVDRAPGAVIYRMDSRSRDREAPEPEEKAIQKRRISKDSLTKSYYDRMIEASKTFLADYGDLISQMGPDDKILITNRSSGERFWYGRTKRNYISVQAKKSDITQFRQGKINRDEVMSRFAVMNTETDDELAPDLELLSSIFNRLYREDLSKTYFSDEGVYYEHLKDFGVIYYMKVYSSREDGDLNNIPTLDLRGLDRKERDEKVASLYPAFEQDMKENMLEYGRTLKSLKQNEQLVFNVELTKCTGCGIPASVELGVTKSVLDDYSTGKLDKSAAVSKISVKKGPKQ